MGVVHLLTQGQDTELLELVRDECRNVPDIIVFGNTHLAIVQESRAILFVNPGSPTLPDYLPKSGAIALLTIDSGEAQAHLVQLD